MRGRTSLSKFECIDENENSIFPTAFSKRANSKAAVSLSLCGLDSSGRVSLAQASQLPRPHSFLFDRSSEFSAFFCSKFCRASVCRLSVCVLTVCTPGTSGSVIPVRLVYFCVRVACDTGPDAPW